MDQAIWAIWTTIQKYSLGKSIVAFALLNLCSMCDEIKYVQTKYSLSLLHLLNQANVLNMRQNKMKASLQQLMKIQQAYHKVA